MVDWFRILGLRPGASAGEIKSAYRTLMKTHHPDVGGDTKKAQQIEAAYRHLSRAMTTKRPAPVPPSAVVTPAVRGQSRYLEGQVVRLESNQAFPCPEECSLYGRSCRYKQQLSLETQDPYALKATVFLLRLRNSTSSNQFVDMRNGRAALIDQQGEFYNCVHSCTYLHPPRYKEATVDMFPHTQATLYLWFPQLPAGRFATRFVYKHKVLVHSAQGSRVDEELMEMNLS